MLALGKYAYMREKLTLFYNSSLTKSKESIKPLNLIFVVHTSTRYGVMDAEHHHLQFLGGAPPVKIIAEHRNGDIIVNYKIIINIREEDTLRREARRLERLTQGAQPS